MTIKIPANNILDKFLRFFGKKRKIELSKEKFQTEKAYGPYSTTIAKKGVFLESAL